MEARKSHLVKTRNFFNEEAIKTEEEIAENYEKINIERFNRQGRNKSTKYIKKYILTIYFKIVCSDWRTPKNLH